MALEVIQVPNPFFWERLNLNCYIKGNLDGFLTFVLSYYAKVAMKLSLLFRYPGQLILGLILIMSSCKELDPEESVVEVPVGIAVSLTGNFNSYGMVQKKALEMAINELNNESETSGFKYIPYIIDDKSDTDTSRTVLRDLIFNKKVMVIIGPTSSNSGLAADSVAQNNKVPLIAVSNTADGITEMGDFIFRTCLGESSVIPNTVLVTHAKLGYSKVAIVFGNDDPYTTTAYHAFKSSFESTPGVTIVSTEIVHKGDTLFTDQLNRVKASNPDIIVLAALVNEASLLMVQAKQLGIPASIRFIGGNSFNTSQLWQKAGQAAQGAICGSAWIASGDSPGNARFVSRYSALYGAIPDQFAAQAYASLYILADAIGRSSPLTRQSLRNSLANTQNLQTILGAFSFTSNREPVHPPVVQELVDGQYWLFR